MKKLGIKVEPYRKPLIDILFSNWKPGFEKVKIVGFPTLQSLEKPLSFFE